MKWCAVIEFMTTESMLLKNIHQQIEVVYGDKCVDITSTKKIQDCNVRWRSHAYSFLEC